MKRMKMAAVLVMVLAVALQLGGCGVGSYQARSVDVKESPLVNPDILVQGKDDQALYRYVNPKADVKQYTMVLIDPVMVYKDAVLDKDEREDYQKLANNAFVYLTKELEKDYRIVKDPEPGTLGSRWPLSTPTARSRSATPLNHRAGWHSSLPGEIYRHRQAVWSGRNNHGNENHRCQHGGTARRGTGPTRRRQGTVKALERLAQCR